MGQYDKQIDKALSVLANNRKSVAFKQTTNIWMIGESGDLKLNSNTACAAGLYTDRYISEFNYVYGKIVALAVSIPIESDGLRFDIKYEEARKHFYNWLLNESVFKDCTYCRDVDKALTRGFVVFKADSHPNLLLEVVRWVRMTYENGLDIVQNYYELVNRGVHPALACNFAYCVSTDSHEFILWWWRDSHQAGGVWMLDPTSVFSFYSGKTKYGVNWDGECALPGISSRVFKTGIVVEGFNRIRDITRDNVSVVTSAATVDEAKTYFDLNMFSCSGVELLEGLERPKDSAVGNKIPKCFDNLAEFINGLEAKYLKPLLKGSE